jgi:hypothetical protein
MTTLCAYHGDLQTFLRDCESRQIGRLVAQGVKDRLEEGYGESERRSWTASLPEFAALLNAAGIRDADIFLEVKTPGSSERCDVLIAGLSERGSPAAVIVELKQWSSATPSAYPDHVTVWHRSLAHPSEQVKGYVDTFRGRHGAFSNQRIALDGCAWLHNAAHVKTIEMLSSVRAFGSVLEDFPMFVAADTERLGSFLRRRVGYGRISGCADIVLASPLADSPTLRQMIVDVIRGNKEWILLGRQIDAFREVVRLVDAARAGSGSRHLFIVRGGPGTGKSTIAIQLLAHAVHRGWRVAHATGSNAFRTVLQGKILHFAAELLREVFNERRKSDIPVKSIFTTFREVAKFGANKPSAQALRPFDLVIGDEGHRLWDVRRNVRSLKPESTVPLIEEMLDASSVTMMLLDDHQGIRANEIGTVDYLQKMAEKLQVRCTLIELTAQFRCGGSTSYLSWIENRMGYDSMRSLQWRRYGGYDFRICSSPAQMQEELAALVRDGKECRMVAGFCWRWSKVRPDGTLVPDVTHPSFDGWSAPWIRKGERNAKPLLNRYFQWVENEEGFGQIGSIYSIQGFEFDYVGVIVGEDLVIRDGRWEVQLPKNKDPLFKDELRKMKAGDEEGLIRLRNVYKVLLTRAMKGTFVFFVDDETRRWFESGLEDADGINRQQLPLSEG